MVSLNTRKSIEFIVYFLLILIISNTAQLCFEQTFRFTVIAIFVAIYIFLRRKLDYVIIGIFSYWVTICVIYALFFGESFVINKIVGYSLPVFTTYLALKIIGASFWHKFEKWIYVLTCISLFMYAGNLLFRELYDSLSPIFGKYIADFYTDARPTAWYAYVYTYSPISELDYIRNAGFMWEAGAFAMTSLLGFIYCTCKNNFELNKHCYIYILAITTTFSSAGYLAIMTFFLYYFTSKKKVWYSFLLALFTIFFIPFIYQLEFMSEKFAHYMNNVNTNSYFFNERLNMNEYNRFLTFEINFTRLFEWPLGYGVYAIKDYFGKEFVGVNGLATFARMWGVTGLCVLVYTLHKTIKMFNKNITRNASYVFALTVLIMFFSNPIEGSPFMWIFILTPFIYKKYKAI